MVPDREEIDRVPHQGIEDQVVIGEVFAEFAAGDQFFQAVDSFLSFDGLHGPVGERPAHARVAFQVRDDGKQVCGEPAHGGARDGRSVTIPSHWRISMLSTH